MNPEPTAALHAPALVRALLRAIHQERLDLLHLAATQRSKYEGWLKFELGAALVTHSKVQHVRFEPPYAGGKADLTFTHAGRTYFIELKTANTSWRAEGLENRRRPITKNINRIIDDIAKLRRIAPDVGGGLCAFTLFPIPTPIWQEDTRKLDYHLQRIATATDLTLDSLRQHADFVSLTPAFGIGIFVLQVPSSSPGSVQ